MSGVFLKYLESMNSFLSICLFIGIKNYVQTVSGFIPSPLPQYCSKKGSTYAIDSAYNKNPPLTSTEASLVGELVQLQVMIRHGARTPYDAFKCWEDYEIPWNNCNVTELEIPSPVMSGDTRAAPWLFRKLYDGSPNKLGGNCFTGQLISEGYEQESMLGTEINERFIGGADDAENGLFYLYNNDSWADKDKERIYFRSTDRQRTLMSGQVFVESLFDVGTDDDLVEWHTGDVDLDGLVPSTTSCPYLEQIQNEAFADPDFIRQNEGNETPLTDPLDAELGKGHWDWGSLIDCFMTASCTGNQVPSSAGYMDQSLYDSAVAQSEFSYFWKMKWNRNQWPKLGMSDTLYNVRINADAAINNNEGYKKFVLYSAHDTSVIPYVDALLGDTGAMDLWAPYASYVTMELYKGKDGTDGEGKYYFRSIYNGQTLQLSGCPDPATSPTGSLCDATTVMSSTLGYAEQNGGSKDNGTGCYQAVDPVDDDCDPKDDDGEGNIEGVTPIGFAGVIILSSLFGALLAGVSFKYHFLDKICGTGKYQPADPNSKFDSSTNPLRP